MNRSIFNDSTRIVLTRIAPTIEPGGSPKNISNKL